MDKVKKMTDPKGHSGITPRKSLYTKDIPEKKEKGTEGLFSKILAKKFPKFREERYGNGKIQEAR